MVIYVYVGARVRACVCVDGDTGHVLRVIFMCSAVYVVTRVHRSLRN